MLRAMVLASLVLGTALSGCLGGSDADSDEPVLKNRAEVSASQGGVQGVVTDPAVQPIAGSTVTLQGTGQTARTAEDGSYAFSRVAPGDYTIRFEAASFVSNEQEVSVRSRVITTVDAILAHLPSSQAFSQQREFTGFVECSVRAGVGFAACGAINLFAGGNATNDRFLFTWPVDPNPWQLVAEIQWEANNPLGTDLSFTVEPEDIPNENQTFYANGVGTSPIVLNIDRKRIAEVDANLTAICNEEKEPEGAIAPSNPDTYCRPPLIEEGGVLMARIFVAAAVDARLPEATPCAAGLCLGGANFGPGVSFQQEYHVIVTMFHNAPACADYSIFLDNRCAQLDRPPEGAFDGAGSANTTGNGSGNSTR